MELEEFKSVWAQYDKKLTENLKINEELLRQINLAKSKNEMRVPLIYEQISTSTGIVFLMYIVANTIALSGELKFLLPGVITSITFIIYVALSIMKIRLLSKIDFYHSSIVDLQKAIATFKHKFLIYKKYELYMYPVFVIAAIPILGKAIRNFDLYEHPIRFVVAVILSMVIFYPLIIWGYKQTFDKRLRNTTLFLEELSKFEKE